MESALRKEYAPLKTKLTNKLPTAHVISPEKFRTNVQQISETQRKRDLIFLLQDILAKLNNGQFSGYEFAYNLQHFFEELIFAETSVQSIKHGLRNFIDKLYAEPVITKLIHYVFKEMQKNLNSRQIDQHHFEPQKILSALQEILDWYIVRSGSIENLFFEDNLNYDQIFDLKVFHDQKRQNIMGMDVLAGLTLYGRAGQNLWVKVFAKEKGEYILPHVDWNSWIDDTEIFTAKPLEHDVALSGIIPVSPTTQRLIIDKLNIFIPYAALDLSPGKHEVEIEICLFNEQGDKLLSVTSDEVLSTPRNYRNANSMVSEQAIGIWSKDYISGDSISDLEVSCVQQPVANMLGDLIRINFDFEVYDRLSESVFLEARFYNAHGALVKTTSKNPAEYYSAIRREIHVDEIVFKRYSVELAIPRIQLHLDDNERKIACEVCLLSSENKVLCGVLENFSLPEERKAIIAPIPQKEPESKQGFLKKFFHI